MPSAYMTIANAEFQTLVDATPTGMFSWVGSGPPDRCCFDCAHFARVDKPRKPELSRRCNRWAAWYRGAHSITLAPKLPIPPETPACSAYVPRSAPISEESDAADFQGSS